MFKKIILGLLIFSLIIVFYSIHTYFFNPFTFERDSITYLPFKYYKNPMFYSYWNYDKNISEERIYNEEEIRFIYKELKKSKILGPNRPNTLSRSEGIFVIYTRSKMNSRFSNATDIGWYGQDCNIIDVSGLWKINDVDTTITLYVNITDELKEFLNSKFNEDK